MVQFYFAVRQGDRWLKIVENKLIEGTNPAGSRIELVDGNRIPAVEYDPQAKPITNTNLEKSSAAVAHDERPAR